MAIVFDNQFLFTTCLSLLDLKCPFKIQFLNCWMNIINHKTDTNNIPNIHDFHPTILKFNHDIKNVWRNFAENS